MAIIIEHLEMPNGCCECRMQTENCCTLSLRKIDDIFTRPIWCRLKEITCKNCKHLNKEEMRCFNTEGIGYRNVTNNDFCSRGVRKEVEK